MRAAVFSGIGKIDVREVPIPKIARDEILLRVRAANICGTDLRIFKNGHHRIGEGVPRILGHEVSGEIWEVGADVEGYAKGMRVAVAPNIGCGKCRYCKIGKSHLCPDYDAFGITLDGGFAEYMRVSSKAISQGDLVPFKKGIGFEEVALAEPLACCYFAYWSVCTQPGENVLIVGAGPMGVLHLLMQRIAGAGKIMMADISDTRLHLIQKFKPDAVINTDKDDLAKAVYSHTDGAGADVIITACPVPDVQRQSVALAAKGGRINLFGGLPKGKELVQLNTNLIHYNNLVLTGTTRYAQSDYVRSVKLIEDKKVDTKPIISKRFGITEVKEAFEYAMSGDGLKTLIEFPG
jgi:L-iditol 2-dehydrogenase